MAEAGLHAAASGSEPRPERRRAGWWSRRGVRARLTLVATALVALGLAAGSLLLVAALQRSLIRAVDDSAHQGAKDVAGLVDSAQLPELVPVAGGVVVQVVDARGDVIASSPGGDRLVSLLDRRAVAAVRAGAARELDGARIGQPGRLRVVGEPAGDAADPQTVLVASPLSAADRSLHLVRLALLVGVPSLVLAFAVACWLLVGSALRPVAELRRGAEEITGSRAARRLPVPAARDEVRLLADTLNTMLDRLEAAVTRQRAFVADAAHELRSPVASIRTQVEVARHHPSSADWEQTSDGVLADVARLSRLVDDLLLLARLDDGETSPLRRGPVDLAELVAGAATQVPGLPSVTVGRAGTDRAAADDVVADRPATGDTGRSPATGATPLLVDGDADALARVVANLLANASRHARSKVAVDVRRAGPYAELTVTDDGAGIPAADRERVFERFTRLDEARSSAAGGSGLGLAIVRQVAQAHGGSAHLEDAEPGVRAVVRLPLLP